MSAQEELGHTLVAVRLDSGDILGNSLYVREQLDAAGLTNVRIIASGDLDEWKIFDLVQAGAAIDAFGVGTALGAGSGSAERGFAGGALGAAYKAVWHVEEDGTEYSTIKLAGSKSTWPGKKEIYRHPGWEEDVIQLAQEPHPEQYQRLLRPVSAVTTQFLDWCCQQLAQAGKQVLVLIWDNATWHRSQLVRTWLHTHNQQVKQSGKGVRIQHLPSH